MLLCLFMIPEKFDGLWISSFYVVQCSGTSVNDSSCFALLAARVLDSASGAALAAPCKDPKARLTVTGGGSSSRSLPPPPTNPARPTRDYLGGRGDREP